MTGLSSWLKSGSTVCVMALKNRQKPLNGRLKPYFPKVVQVSSFLPGRMNGGEAEPILKTGISDWSTVTENQNQLYTPCLLHWTRYPFNAKQNCLSFQLSSVL